MILDARTLAPDSELTAAVAVVGSGPGGIVTALELADAGIDVVLLESGARRPDAAAQRLGDAARWDTSLHAPMSLATNRQVGGASVTWGGRCVPYDPIDFEPRCVTPGSDWPIGYDDVAPLFLRACSWLACGRAAFDARDMPHLPPSIVPGLPDGDVTTSSFERWSLPTNFGRHYHARLRRSRRLRLVTRLTCTEVVCRPDATEVDHLEARGPDGRRIVVRARRYVLACGGLETTRLLLASTGPGGGAIGNHSDHLGRWYMGHVEGIIAHAQFTTPPQQTIFGYERDMDGVYVRRRLALSAEAQRRLKLPNVVGWLANPDLPDPSHHSGVLSFSYLALVSPLGRLFAPEAQRRTLTGEDVPGAPYPPRTPGPLRGHVRNLVRDAGATMRFVASFGARRFLARRRRVPGFFVHSPDNTYPLQYHAEHLPHRDSRVTLAPERDALGMPRLDIDIRFADEDVEGVVRAHEAWDAHLRQHDCGRLEYLTEDPAAAVRRNAGGGFHQLGTTRMSAQPADGVLDTGLAVHGFDDLFVVSSSAVVTSSQANSTFMIVVFALRVADRLRGELRG